MDSHHATVVGRVDAGREEFAVLAVANNAGAESNSSEKNENNDVKTLQHKFFKTILSHMQNAEEVHITGTGTSQEQLMRYMSATPQFKNTNTKESTSNKMSDEKLLEYIAAKFLP